MKKCFLLSSLLAILIQGVAQVKVDNNGNTLFGYSASSTPLSAISVNCIGRQDSKVVIQGTELGVYSRRTGNAH